MAQITITVNPVPADAEVKINGNIGNTSSVESDSEVSISSQNGNVTIGQIYEARDTQGERIFVVPITYKSPGRDVLIASRKGDSDIYLEFDYEATSVPASSISFNTDSINLNI